MSGSKVHIETIKRCINEWLRPDNKYLQQAIVRTVDERLFSFEDIKHQVLTLKSALKPANIEHWVLKSGITPNSLRNRTVLCLHAGNLPLVGVQDLIAVIILGANYAGKLSKKDPYLLQSLIRIFKEHDVVDHIHQSTELETFYGLRPDAWLFSGSLNNASAVENLLTEKNTVYLSTPSLIRTSFYSMAYIDNLERETMTDLTESVFRYGGSGCRSVAMVVSPCSLNEIKCSFTDYIEGFWLNNPQQEKPPQALMHRYALNKAVGIEQAWINDFLIEEGVEIPRQKFILKWHNGDFSTFSTIIKSNKKGLQSVYSTAEHIGKKVGNRVIEPLSTAQEPPIWWKPDGIDTLDWLQKNISCEDQRSSL